MEQEIIKKKVGRPRTKNLIDNPAPKRGRGRPRKNPIDIVPQKETYSEESSNVRDELRDIPLTKDTIEYPEVVKPLTPKKLELEQYHNKIKQIALDDFQIESNESDGKFECVMCHKLKPKIDYFKSYSLMSMGTLDNEGDRHQLVCKHCARKIFKFYYTKYHNLKLALHHWCQTTDFYFDDDLFNETVEYHKSKDSSETKLGKTDLLTDYIIVSGRQRVLDKTYWDSPSLVQFCNDQPLITDEELCLTEKRDYDYPEEIESWNQLDLDNYTKVVETYKFDPFEDEEVENRKRMYHNLASITTDDMMEDYTKSNAAIDMVRAIQHVEILNSKIRKLEKQDNIELKIIKDLSDLRNKERNAINNYGKEYGFNSKYSGDKGLGSGSLTGILKEMDTALFEDSLANRYDVSTSVGIQQAAEASWKAIFEQLDFSSSEYGSVIKDQNEMIRKLQSQVDDLGEQLRLANIKIKHSELEKYSEEIQNLNGKTL